MRKLKTESWKTLSVCLFLENNAVKRTGVQILLAWYFHTNLPGNSPIDCTL